MSEDTPSQAEGERDETGDEERVSPPRTTPSQAEGEDDGSADDTDR